MNSDHLCHIGPGVNLATKLSCAACRSRSNFVSPMPSPCHRPWRPWTGAWRTRPKKALLSLTSCVHVDHGPGHACMQRLQTLTGKQANKTHTHTHNTRIIAFLTSCAGRPVCFMRGHLWAYSPDSNHVWCVVWWKSRFWLFLVNIFCLQTG